MARARYTAKAELSGGWWAITVPELPGAYSQARRLDRVEPMTRDLIALWLDVAPDSFDIVVREELDPAIAETVRAAEAARSQAAARQREATAKTRAAAEALRARGLPQRDIGRILKLSHQRVAQLLATAD